VAEYLALELVSEERYEYLDGQIYAMAGESPERGHAGAGGRRITTLTRHAALHAPRV
jgi:hypothetical protein